MELNQISDNEGARKLRTRVGRGIGSGKGKTCGRGVKGQKSRTGVSINGFEGGQMPIFRRLPKRGFTNIFRTEYEVVNVSNLQKAIDDKKLDASKIDTQALVKAGLVRAEKSLVKLLGDGELTAKVSIAAHKASKSAIEKVEKAGGSVTILVQESPEAEPKANAKKQKKA